MLRDLAYLMNTAKWSYLILVAKAHRNIRRLNFLAESKVHKLKQPESVSTLNATDKSDTSASEK